MTLAFSTLVEVALAEIPLIPASGPPTPPFGPRFPTGKILILDVVQGYIFGYYPTLNESCQIILYTGPGYVLGGNVNLLFTLPDGSEQYGDPEFAYVGNVPIVQKYIANFAANQYVVYTFAVGELFQPGNWSVVIGVGNFVSNPIPFKVLPTGVQ